MFVVELVQTRPRAAALYVGFFVSCVTIYKMLEARATGKHDYLLTLSAGLQALAFLLLVIESKSQVGEGLSEKTLWTFFAAHITRLSTTFWGEAYVPEDNTSDVYLYQLLELVGVVLVAYKLLKLMTLRNMVDVGQGIERWSMLLGLAAVSLVLAFFTKSTGHNDYLADLSWMFSVWLEAFALGPQVWLLWFTSGQVDESGAHFAGLTLSASLTFALFWGRVARERYAEFQKEREHGFFVAILLAACIRVCLCAVYVYLFSKSSKSKAGGRGEYELCASDEL